MIRLTVFFLGAISSLCFISCKSRSSNDSSVKADYFRDWDQYKSDPERFFALLAQEQAIPGNCRTAEQFNKFQMDKLNQMTITSPEVGRRNHINVSQAEILYKAVANHPVASLRNYSKYDPRNEGIGYCFGRAMTAHLEALWNPQLKVNNKAIRKLFALGKLQTGTDSWRYHVTTIVKASDNGWWAIDPIMGKPIKADDWYSRMRSYNPSGDMLLFSDEAARFSPAEGMYKKNQLDDDFYSNYFKDLLNSYRGQFQKRGTAANLTNSAACSSADDLD